MLVHRAPQQVRFAAQGDKHLVEVPRTTGLGSGGFHPTSKTLTELIAPTSNRLVRHNHAALEKQFFNVAQAPLNAEVPAHRTTDNLGWKAVAVIERFRFLHRAILSDHAPNLTVPCKVLGTHADQRVEI